MSKLLRFGSGLRLCSCIGGKDVSEKLTLIFNNNDVQLTHFDAEDTGSNFYSNIGICPANRQQTVTFQETRF